MRRLILALAAFTIAVGLVAPLAVATPEFAKKETKGCLFCHTAMGKPDLNDAGKYYKQNNYSLEGYGKKKP